MDQVNHGLPNSDLSPQLNFRLALWLYLLVKHI